MDKEKEKPSRLVKWKVHIIATLAMVVFAVWFLLGFCNYVDGNTKIILYCFMVSFLIITAIYFFRLRSIDQEDSIKWLVIVIMMVTVELSIWDAYNHKCFIGEKSPITLEYLVGFLLTMATIYLFWRRVRNQEEQIKIEAFNVAVGLLGSEQTSARTGAIYSLYRQAVEDKKYRGPIVQILCSHIRSKTREESYQEHHKYRPSNEIQTTIDLLFREIEKQNKGLYIQFGQELPKADLSHAYCTGADFLYAHCQRASFWRANCQGAYFFKTNCQGADFWKAHCEGASFWGANCQGAYFRAARCQGADFKETHCEGADFRETHCEGANFRGTFCQGADFKETHCEGAYSSDGIKPLESRIGKKTEFTLVLEGALSQQSIDAIGKAKPYRSSNWYAEWYAEWYPRMQKIIESNKDKEKKFIPHDDIDGVISEVLEDSDGELRELSKLLKDIKKEKFSSP